MIKKLSNNEYEAIKFALKYQKKKSCEYLKSCTKVDKTFARVALEVLEIDDILKTLNYNVDLNNNIIIKSLYTLRFDVNFIKTCPSRYLFSKSFIIKAKRLYKPVNKLMVLVGY